jgi:plasmid stabilization system protein ParE
VKPFIVSPLAADDLHAIWLYLAEEASEEFADHTIEKLARTFAELAEMPGLGHRRSDLTRLRVHFYFAAPYMVIYQRDCSPLAIHAVLHGARDLRTILRHRPL